MLITGFLIKMGSSPTSSAVPYRREIDGLRAVAVVSVLLFHAGVPGFTGGFVGVDIFFVISGYLISSIIFTEMREGRFRFGRFAERRIRRIFPALFVVCVATIPFAYVLLLPEDLIEFSRSTLAAMGSFANVFFWINSGYFEGAAGLKPLLHTWSLSLEEQFYLVFPLLALGLFRFLPSRRTGVLVVMTVLGMVLAEIAVQRWPSATFYLLPTRAWELLLGSTLAAIGTRFPANRGVALVGLGLIGFAIVWFDHSTRFPGASAAIPAFGAALFIGAARADTWPGRALGTRLPVFIGLISYSLYLWHQPVLAFAHHWLVREPELPIKLGLMLLSVALAYISWKIVETPFRAPTVSRGRLAASLIGLVAVAGGFALAVDANGGMPGRIPPAALALASPQPGDSRNCRLTVADIRAGRECRFGKGEAVVAIVGDSHARRLVDAFESAPGSSPGLLYSSSWCAPLLGVRARGGTRNPSCESFVEASLEAIAANKNIQTVVIHAQWANYIDGWRWGDPEIVTYEDADGGDDAEQVFVRGLLRTRDALKRAGKRIVLIRSIPEFEVDVPWFLAGSARNGEPTVMPASMITGLARYADRNRRVENAFAEARIDEWADTFAPASVLCDPAGCAYVEGSQSLYSDANHVSFLGHVNSCRLGLQS